MKQRGRKSSASLTVIPLVPGQPQRPEPPPEFTRAGTGMGFDGWWDESDWFGPETHPALKAYCTTVANAEMVAHELRKTSIDDKSIAKLAALHRRLSQAMVSIAVKLRITPHNSPVGA